MELYRISTNNSRQKIKMSIPLKKSERGFSIIELLMVIAVVAILSVFAVMTLRTRDIYSADKQAYTVLDYLKEARQRAITQREVMRVELNRNTGTVRLLNENEPGDVTDDVEIRKTVLGPGEGVVFDSAPDNIDSPPVEPIPVPEIVFKPSVHPTSAPDYVATLRFLPNGTVEDAGTNEVGDNAVTTGATIYFWSPITDATGAATTRGNIIRAITVAGASGNTHYVMCPLQGATCTQWK